MAIATHVVTVKYFVSESEKTEQQIRLKELPKWKMLLRDSLENLTVTDINQDEGDE